MPDVLYAPVLKGRQGEFGALGQVQPSTRQHTLPILEIVPGPPDQSERAAQMRSVIERAAAKLKVWAGNRLLLDAGFLETHVILREGFGAVGHSIIEAIEHGVDATPVVRLDDGPQAHRDAATLHAETRHGVAIRLGADDLDEDPEDIEIALADLLRVLAAAPQEADLVLDLGVVNGDLSVRAGSRLIADALRGLDAIGDWRNVIVTAGAFPADLAAYSAWTLGEPPRYDAMLYDHLRQRRRLPRVPIFGDYAVAYPMLVTGLPHRAPPQLRYTVADRWLVLKGRLNDPRGHEQFYDVCDIIAKHPDFAGAALGNADARIANAHGKGPGNASTWREIGTTHHLDYLVQRITTLGEP
jgi:hypothetical protein